VRFLTPTGNKRLNELIGFLCMTAALLVAAALITYHPNDASFNVATSPAGAVRNVIGPVGAYTADALFQVLGFPAFLLPMGLLWLGIRWFRSRAVESQKATVIGYGLMLLFLPVLLTLIPFLDVRGAIPAGGMTGKLLSGALLAGFNFWGALIVTIALLITASFLTTTFSFGGAHAWASGPRGPVGVVGKLGIYQRAQAKWQDWRENREQERMRRRVEANRLGGRKPVGKGVTLEEAPKTIRLADESDVFRAKTEEDEEEVADKSKAHKAPILFLNQEKPEKAAKKSGEPKIAKDNPNYRLPPINLLREGERSQKLDEEELKDRARAIEEKCLEFDVQGRVTQINPGPVVTTFEFKPEAGIKYSRIIGLTEDLCLALQAESILIERIPGKSTIGIEVPNLNRQTIALREIIEAQEFVGSASKLTLAMGRDLHGRIRVTDLASMPHLLIAGSTGTGKSVFINSLLMSILYKATPDDVKIVLVDPKRLELNLYEGIPHLIAPVVTDPKIASNVLRNATREMENRLKLLAQKGVRNIEQYNRTFQKTQSLSLFDNLEESEHKPLPYLVIIIDELADLMMVDTNNVEESITRLAQMARAVGIHLILATQRPSVDVITGLIKANFPSRIAFSVASKIDSRTILDQSGAEALLGAGDMLFSDRGAAPVRLHGCYVDEEEIHRVVAFLKTQGRPVYNLDILKPRDEDAEGGDMMLSGAGKSDDDMYDKAVYIVTTTRNASISWVQRQLRIGYNRAARLVEEMEKQGVVSPPDHTNKREVLVATA